jgi:MFS family permease
VWLINRNFARLWWGQAISLVGDFVFDTTLVLWVGTVLLRGDRYAPAAVAGVLLAVAAATMLVGPLAGVFVDRWDNRRTMLAADLIRAGLVGLLTVVAFLPSGTLPVPVTLVLAYLTVLLSTAAGTFFNPARFALIGDVVEGDAARAKATGLGQVTQALAGIVGPPLAAPLLFTVGVQYALLLNALSFLVSFVAVRSVKVDRPAPAATDATRASGVWREFAAGLAVVGRSRALIALLVTIVVVTLGAGALNALDVFFVSENLHAPARWYGTLGMALGAGLIVGALAGGTLTAKLGAVRVLCAGLLIAGLGFVGYARLDHLWQALILLPLLGIPIGALNTAFTPILLNATPRAYVGRVISVVNPVQQLAQMVSVLAAGWLVSTVLRDLHATVGGVHVGRIDAVFTGGGVLILAGALYATVALRGADTPQVVEAGPTEPTPAEPATPAETY